MANNTPNQLDQENQRLQFTELNNRSGWYSAQLWQLPFTYLAVTAVAIANLDTGNQTIIGWAFLGAFILGVFVCWHMKGLLDGEKRAVENLQKAENQLGLPCTVEYKRYTEPLWYAVLLATGIFLICAIVVFYRVKASGA